ncbi:hypothetical protein WMY93_017888 [Mugilogobius chulae]|uniref:EGF-like domain-containing protein n=1 Tax=Mugilogobius chulae TaxID=88201 RepID=A0AAW0NUK9_9GOBI
MMMVLMTMGVFLTVTSEAQGSSLLPLSCPASCFSGSCVNGTCVCDRGWVGDRCQHCQGRFSCFSISAVRVISSYKSKCEILYATFACVAESREREDFCIVAQDVLSALESSFSDRLIHPRCAAVSRLPSRQEKTQTRKKRNLEENHSEGEIHSHGRQAVDVTKTNADLMQICLSL